MWTDLDSKLSEQAFEKDLQDQTVSLAQELATGIGVQQIIGVPEVLQQEIEAFNRLRRDLSGLEVFLASPHRPVLAASTPGSSLAIPMPEAWERTLEGHVLTSLEPNGGILHIATERGLPRCRSAIVDHRPQRAVGDYIVMNITATGVGIAAADLQRIFEPFFTTKAPGGHIEQD